MSRGMWKTVETKVKEVRMAEAGRSRKETRREEGKEKEKNPRKKEQWK